MIVVTGATGQLGRLVIEQLLSRMPAAQVVAAVRHPDRAADLAKRGVQVRHADYTLPHTLDAAFVDARKVLLISSNEVGRRTMQHRSVIDAAARASVHLLAYTSLLHADTSELGLAGEHRDTEAHLRAVGLPHVLLRNGWYTENFLGRAASALQDGELIGSAGAGRFAPAARADYAEAAAAVLLRDDQAGQVHELAGDDSFTLAEFAVEVGRRAGSPLTYHDHPEAAYREALEAADLPSAVATFLAAVDACAARGALFDNSHALSRLIGRPTTHWSSMLGVMPA